MKKVILFITASVIAVAAFAQNQSNISGASLLRMSEEFGIPSYVQFKEDAQFGADEFYYQAKKILQMQADDKLVEYKKEKDDIGFTHTRYIQKYKGLSVAQSMIICHEKEGKVVSINGDFYPHLNINSSPTLSSVDALELAKKYSGGKIFMWDIKGENENLKKITKNPNATYFPTGELQICAKDGEPKKKDFRLVYKFDIYTTQPLARQDIYVDAKTGELVFTHQTLCYINNSKGTAKTKYSGTQTINTDSVSSSKFQLRDSVLGGGVETFNMKTGKTYTSAVDFTDANNYWNNVNSAQDEAATDAHFGAEKVWEYYFYTNGRNSVDNNGFKLLSYVHFDVSYQNAYWDGLRMTYGDGNGTSTNIFTALDVCGHEITHGVTSNSAKLGTSYEGGALNESFSDIMGTAVEFYARPTNANWIMAEDITKSGTGFRNLKSPKSISHPNTYKGTNWYSGAADNGGVHTNCAVQNFWFYLLSMGGSGTNDNGNAYNVTAISVKSASRIAYRNLAFYLTSTAQYADARFYSLVAASDLFGLCSNEYKQTVNAWYAVGVGGKYDSLAKPLSGTYTVGGTTPDFTTFTAAVTSLNRNGVCGAVTFNVRDGSYNERIRIGSVPGTTPYNSVVFQSEKGDSSKVKLTFASSSSAAKNYTLNCDSSRYISFKKISISRTGTNTYGVAVYLSNRASDISLIGNKISGVYATNTGVTDANSLIKNDSSFTRNLIISGNLLKYGMNSVFIYGSTSAHPIGNLIEGNVMDSFSLSAVFTGYNNNLSIRRNIMRSYAFSTAPSVCYGIRVDNSDSGLIIANNKVGISGNGATARGIYVQAFNGYSFGYIFNNFVTVTTGTSASTCIRTLNCFSLLTYFNNLLNTSTLTTGAAMWDENTSGNNCYHVNNNYINKGSGYAIYHASNTLNYCNYNNLYKSGTNLGFYNSTSYTTIAAWRTATGKDAGSKNVDPTYTSTFDLHASNSAINGAGVGGTGITADIDGEARNNSFPDIGADEFLASGCLSGSYTIGGSSPNYATIKAAVKDLMQKGVCGAVTFNIRDGIYTEKVRIGTIPGSSPTNTVTFQSQSLDSNKVFISDTSSVAGTANYTFSLDSTTWVTLKKISIRKTGTKTYGSVLQIAGWAQNNNILNCQLIGVKTTTNTFNQSAVSCVYANDSNILFKNNLIKYGSWAVVLIGDSIYKAANIRFDNNTVDSFYSAGVFYQYGNRGFVTNNIITQNPSGYTGGMGLGVYNQTGRFTVIKNKINLGAGGLGMLAYNFTNSFFNKATIANNFIAANNNSEGLVAISTGETEVFYNNINIYGSDSNSWAFEANSAKAFFYMHNNNFVNHAKGYAMWTDTISASFNASDYNNFYGNGHRFIHWKKTDFTSFSAYKTASGLDANSLNTDPGYSTTSDLHVTSSSLDKKGKVVTGIADDIDGQKRSTTTPDIGADEFTPSNTDAGITAIQAPNSAFCIGTKSVKCTLKNFGSKTITSASIKWTVNGTAKTTYSWTGTLATNATDTAITLGSVSFTAGSYTIKVWSEKPNTVTDSTPGNDTFSIKITVYGTPTAAAGSNKSICNGGSTSIGATAVSGSTYSWSSSPSGFTSTSPNPTVSPTATTTYTITETNAGGCSASNSVTITVNPLPTVNAGKDTAFCIGGTAKIGTTTTSGHTYSWTSSPSGFTSTLGSTTTTPSATTIYILSESITATGCSKSDSIKVTVNPLPSATTGGNKSLCSGSSTILGSTSVSGHTYSWVSKPSGFTSTASNPTVSPTVTTTYTLTEITTATGCSKSDTAQISVNPLPTANAGSAASICAGGSVGIGATAVSGNTYSWSSSPSGFTSTVSNPTVTPTATTTYSLTEKVTATGCTKTNTVVITVNPAPAANVGSAAFICSGKSTTIGASSVSGNTYAWTSNPSGFTSTISNPTVSPTVTTVYKLIETNSTTTCSKTDSVKITVNPIPAAPTASSNSPICVGGTLNLSTATVSGAGYNWTGANSFTSTQQNPSRTSITLADSGTYSLTITVSGCTSPSGKTTVIVNPLPNANVGTAGAICLGTSLQIGATAVSGNTYSWTSNPTGFTSTQSNPTVTPTTSTYYKLTETSFGCSKTDSVLIKVNATPKPNAGSAKSVCKGTSAIIGGSATAGSTYAWTSNPAGFTSTVSNPTVTPTVNTTYIVTETITASGCSKKDSVAVTVNAIPLAKTGNKQSICIGKTTQIGDSAIAGNTYAWVSNPTGFTSTQSNPIVSPTVSTTYTLTETVTAAGCSNTGTVTITVNPLPNVNWAAVETSSHNFSFHAADTSLTTYKWIFGDGFSGAGFSTTHTYAKDSTYTVTLLATNSNGCATSKDSTLKIITGIENPTAAMQISIFPNPFTAQTTLAYTLNTKANVKVEITDILGKKIAILQEGNQTHGTHQLTLDATKHNLKAGVYFVKFYADGVMVTKRVVKMK
ncbi:MAG: M4 family metallopeptidase [Bacteroidetes bacterium]|nr:M4 family metallopeptidase [Bacteroidota bacterium]